MRSGPFIAGLFLFLAACAGPREEKISLAPVSFGGLPGWQNDRQSEALAALRKSCAPLAAKEKSWRSSCAALAAVPAGDDAAARAYFEDYFTPYAASGSDGEEGLFTGYYEPELRGSPHKTKRFRYPLWQRPKDLINIDLGLFKPEWKGKRIAGKVRKNALVPYDDRAAIEQNSLKGRAKVLLWVDDPVDAFFLAVQGSGRVRLPDGKIIQVGYDGANGRSYVAIGRALAEMDEIGRPVTMEEIRAWLDVNPERAQGIMNLNPSYVFFRHLKGAEAVGAEGVELTPRRSLAVDPAFVKLGSPLWLDTQNADGAPLQRLMVAQDTGGAIKGPVRGDFFWGSDEEAAAQAGAMQSRGRYYILLPKGACAANGCASAQSETEKHDEE